MPYLPINPAHCPLCGQPNSCVMAATGSNDAPCWCRDESIPESLLQQLPEAARKRACICGDCVQKHREGR